jgi:hypothetical protein
MAQLLAALQGGWVAGDTARQVLTRAAAAAAPISAAQDSGSVAAVLLAIVAAGGCAGADAAADEEFGAVTAAAGVSSPAGTVCAGAPSRPHPNSANAAAIPQTHFIFRIGASCRRSGSARRRSAPGIVWSDARPTAAPNLHGSVSGHRCTPGMRPA